jgi:hypothetical protein
LLLRYMQPHGTMVPYGSAAQMQLFASHSKCSPILGTALLGKRNLPLDTSKLHFSTVRLKVLKHKPPAHTQKLCVIKQLHSTQRVSMTTKKLLGKLQKKPPLYPCFSQEVNNARATKQAHNWNKAKNQERGKLIQWLAGRTHRFDAIAPCPPGLIPSPPNNLYGRQLIHPKISRGPIHSVFRCVFRTGIRGTLRIMMNLNRNQN